MKPRTSIGVAAAIAIATTALDFVAPTSAHADGGICPVLSCDVNGDGAHVGLTEEQTSRLPPSREAEYEDHGKKVRKAVPYKYDTLLDCGHNSPGAPEASCERAHTACQKVPHAEGPLVRIYRQLQVPGKKTNELPWESVGTTCWPDKVPNAKHKPRLTVAMIKEAFVKTPFAKPHVSVQPVGNRTLVNLPTYFQVVFPQAGIEPGEVRTVTLLGHKVRIKAVLKSNTYRFGDGASLGPTTSSGGTWPDGDVRHTYLKRGTVATQITTIYGGQFSVDGGKFVDLPGTATITGPSQSLEVLEASTRLVR